MEKIAFFTSLIVIIDCCNEMDFICFGLFLDDFQNQVILNLALDLVNLIETMRNFPFYIVN